MLTGNNGGCGRRFLFAHEILDMKERVERQTPAAEEHESGGAGEECKGKLDAVHRLEEAVRVGGRSVQRIGELHDQYGNCHCARQEERIDTRQKAGDEENRAEELGVRGDVSEERGDVVAGKVGGEGGNPSTPEDFRVAVGDEDQPERHAQKQRGDVAGPRFHDRVITPLALFVCFYLATFWILARIALAQFQWIALASACCATVATIALWNHGEWDLGLSPRFAPRELAFGALFAIGLIGGADLIIMLVTPVRHVAGSGFPFADTIALFVPAALHEELVFRGYPYQLLRRFNRWFAIIVSSIVFAALHAGNDDVTMLALVNIFGGGVILALAYERYRRLWMPIGLHFTWNIMSGPILGYDVSGFTTQASLLRAVVRGPAMLSGGAFGIEGSIVLTVVELAAALLLLRISNFKVRMKN